MSSPSSKKANSEAETKSESETDPSPLKSSDTIKSTDHDSESKGKNVSDNAWSTDTEHSTDSPLDLGSAGSVEARLMQIGSEALLRLEFQLAAMQFKRALDILVKEHGDMAEECALAYFKRGLALMYEVENPRSKDVMVSLWIKETGLDTYKPSPVQSDSSEDEVYQKWEDSAKCLDNAWVISNRTPGDSTEKVDMLAALGELSYRRGKDYSENFYREAVLMLERLPGKNYLLKADLTYKLCLCVAKYSKDRKEVALDYLKKANSVLEDAKKELLSEYKSAETVGKTVGSGSNQEPSNIDPIDPSISRKADTLTMLFELGKQFLEKISFSIDVTQVENWSFAKQVLGGRPNILQRNQFESPTESTANTREIRSGVGDNRGVKRKLSLGSTSTESTPTKDS